MEFIVEKMIAVFVAIVAPILSILDLPGNTMLFVTSLGFAVYNDAKYLNCRLLAVMLLVYLIGEVWQFCMELFGIRRKKVSWMAVFLISMGGFAGTLLGTMLLPVLGSLFGGMLGAFFMAFLYELFHSGKREQALSLALAAAKVRFLALLGKLVAALVLAILLLKQVVFYNL